MQDDTNRCGGKWIVRLRKGLASRCWENLILAMLGEQFMVGDEICGAVVSIRFAVGILKFSFDSIDLEILVPYIYRKILYPCGIALQMIRPPLIAFETR